MEASVGAVGAGAGRGVQELPWLAAIPAHVGVEAVAACAAGVAPRAAPIGPDVLSLALQASQSVDDDRTLATVFFACHTAGTAGV